MRAWLKELRVSAKKTMKQVATELGISEGYYCSIENGDRQKRMDSKFILGIADAIGVPAEIVLKREAEYMESMKE